MEKKYKKKKKSFERTNCYRSKIRKNTHTQTNYREIKRNTKVKFLEKKSTVSAKK